MDKYLLVVLAFLIAGMGIGITFFSPQYVLFYSMLAGALIVIFYSSYKTRKQKQKERKERRSKK